MPKFHMHNFDAEYRTKSSLSFLQPVLCEWLKIQREYMEWHWDEEDGWCDNLYYYNERANTSGIAGAAWRVGGMALEEYNTKRGKGKSATSGRADLYLVVAGKCLAAESKMVWLRVSGKNGFKQWERTRTALTDAVKDVKSLVDINEMDYGLGLTFVVPSWKRPPTAPGAAIAELATRLKSLKTDLYAHFIDNTESPLKTDWGRYFGAVFLLGNACH